MGIGTPPQLTMSDQQTTTATNGFDANSGSTVFTGAELAVMEQIKQRMKDFKHIHFQTDNMFLAKYLRAFDWDIEKSLEVMLQIYKMRRDHPTWFALKRVSDYMPLLMQNQRYVLSERDRCGRRIFVYKLSNTTPETTLLMAAQMDDMWYECMMTENQTQLNGMIVIIDFKDTPWCCLKWLQPKQIRIGSDKSDLLPLKGLQVHLVNQSTVMNTVTQAVRPFMSKALLEKFHFHSKNDFEGLHAVVGRDCLPEEYGGPKGKTVDYEYAYRFLLHFEEFIFANRQYGIIKPTTN